MEKQIRIADMAVSDTTSDILVAREIGSGIGLVIYDPVSRVGGILHFLLPDSAVDRKTAGTMPFMFADTAIPEFLGSFSRCGGQRERARILVAGGSQIMDSGTVLAIGKQNHKILLDMLDTEGVHPDVEDIGGQANRGVKLSISTGEMYIRNSRASWEVRA